MERIVTASPTGSVLNLGSIFTPARHRRVPLIFY